MKKKKALLAQMIAVVMAAALTACGGSGSSTAAPAESTPAAEEAAAESTPADTAAANPADAMAAAPDGAAEAADAAAEEDPMVDVIDLSFDEGNLKYVGFEEANEGLTEEEKALVFKFDFTNNQTKPCPVHDVFWIRFFQNGAELQNNTPYSSKGGEQYDLVKAFFSNAMKGGTVTFGCIVVPKDDSPITIMASRNGDANAPYQMMEVNISDPGAAVAAEVPAEEMEAAVESAEAEGAIPSKDEIEDMLQGEWGLNVGAGSTFTFDDGDLTVESKGQVLEGTYEVNIEDSCIDGFFETNDGQIAKIHLPFKFDQDGNMELMNNANEKMTKN